jgi:hypothetical protein
MNIFKQLEFAIVGDDGKMQLKELGTLVMLLSFVFLLVTRAFFNVLWEDVWIQMIVGGFIVNVFGGLTYNYLTKTKASFNEKSDTP